MAVCPSVPPDFEDWVGTCLVGLREQGRVPEEPLLRAALIGLRVLDPVTMHVTDAYAALRDAVAAGDPTAVPDHGIEVAMIAELDPAVAALIAA